MISYLRNSVTERCNFRCVYCMPADGISLAQRDDLLSFEEIVRVVRVGAKLGLTKIRLTGGEPTVRRAKTFQRTANLRWSGHQMNAFVPIYSRREMVRIGG